MAKIVKTRSLSYDDVTLLAQIGEVESRREIPIEGARIVVSSMSSLIGGTFLLAVSKLKKEIQPTIHIPRDERSLTALSHANYLKLQNIFVGVGLNTPKIEDFGLKMGYNTAFIDTASGYLPQIEETINRLKDKGYERVIAGSVHTTEGVYYLQECGVDIIRLGIGTSSQICSTRYQTGFYRATITEILECVKVAEVPILADGGYIYPGDYVKSFAAGSDYCMGARLFTKAKEAQMHVDGTGEHFGMSNSKKGVSNSGFDESFTIKVDDKDLKPLFEIMEEIWNGIRSGVSYSGYSTVDEMIGNGVFEIKHRP